MSHTANRTLTIQVFGDVNPCWLIKSYQCSGRACLSSKPRSHLILLLQNVS